jgi:hypothetical protein
MAQATRGVYVERTVGRAIRITAIGHDEEVLLVLDMAEDWHDPEVIETVKRWLDRMVPPLSLVR